MVSAKLKVWQFCLVQGQHPIELAPPIDHSDGRSMSPCLKHDKANGVFRVLGADLLVEAKLDFRLENRVLATVSNIDGNISGRLP